MQYPTTDDDYGLGIHRSVICSAIIRLLQSLLNGSLCRAKFLEALAEIIDTTLATAHFNKRCVSVENSSSRPIIHFADGTTHETDLVLGADGIRSAPHLSFVHRGLRNFSPWLPQEHCTCGCSRGQTSRGFAVVQQYRRISWTRPH